ncbi:MAG: hypothetical protein J07HB67_02850 [halophilic archaeon J07HB67]|jgi:hypothetical protein|nr:MAG: hypothetical protein J07HB67_02850 [halophilic archaeon J07HB67]
MLGGDSGRLLRPATTLLVPVVGVVVFDWRLRFVLLFYWLEIGLTTLRQTVEATFAGRPNSEDGRTLLPAFRKLRTKRGGVSMPGPLPPVYPRTAPAVILGGTVSLAVWLFAGTQIVALGGRVDLSAPPLEILLGTPVDTSVLVSLLSARPVSSSDNCRRSCRISGLVRTTNSRRARSSAPYRSSVRPRSCWSSSPGCS